MCRRSQEDGFLQIKCDGIDTVAKCPTGEVPKLCEKNRGFKFLLDRMLPGLCDAYGGFDFNAIGHVFELYGVPEGQRPVIHDKLMVVIDVIREVRKAEEKGRGA